MNNKLVMLVPCYNEEEILEYSIKELTITLDIMIDDGLISTDSKICFVNDGSSDKTGDILCAYCRENKKISTINLTRNFGQQNAILAGLNIIKADMVVTIDADLQDDYTIIPKMVEKYFEGCDVVYGVRQKREPSSLFKKISALMFYKFMNVLGVQIRKNHSEFRLLSANAIEKLKEYKEKTIFLRGLVQNLGLKSSDIYYDGNQRLAGKSKYSIFKLFGLAWNAITSFSLLPLRMITFVGLLTSLISVIIFIYGVISCVKHYAVPGWTSIIITVAFFNGIIIMSLGIIGEYLGKVLTEVKNRPLYQVSEIINL